MSRGDSMAILIPATKQIRSFAARMGLFCCLIPVLFLSDATAFAETPAKARRLPRAGMLKVGSQVFALSTTDCESKMPAGFCGSFGRELIRQSLLISAREELGLSTLDTSIGEISFVTDSPETYPYQLDVRLEPVPGDEKVFSVSIEIALPSPSGAWRSWSMPPIKIETNSRLTALAERFEIHSRTIFPTALKELGFAPSSDEKPAVAATEEIEDHLDFVTQFARLRNLHSQRRLHGESMENLGALARAYANLGHLIDFHWSAASKAFKARSVLYSQRLLAKYGPSSFAFAHRAYTRALAGNHVVALADVGAAETAQGQAAPVWLKLIKAFCEYQPEVLEETTGPQKELALYLRMRLVDPNFDKDAGLLAIENFMEANPTSCRAVELICDMRALGLTRSITEGGADRLWPGIYRQLAAIPNLPENAKSIAVKQSKVAVAESDPAKEHPARVEFIDKLRQAGTNAADPAEPSWLALAELVDDVSFIQVWRVIDCENTMLGLKSDTSIDELYPLVAKHRIGPCIKCYSKDKDKARAAIAELMKRANPITVELPGVRFAVFSFYVNAQFYRDVATEAIRHRDLLFDDLLRAGASNIKELYNDAFDQIGIVAPYQPRSIAWAIKMSKDFPRNGRPNMETTPN